VICHRDVPEAHCFVFGLGGQRHTFRKSAGWCFGVVVLFICLLFVHTFGCNKNDMIQMVHDDDDRQYQLECRKKSCLLLVPESSANEQKESKKRVSFAAD
jgi:hypothetical protein